MVLFLSFLEIRCAMTVEVMIITMASLDIFRVMVGSNRQILGEASSLLQFQQ